MSSNDDLYLHDGDTYQDTVYAPPVPAEQTAAINAELAPAQVSYPIMPAVAAWFDQAVKDCDNIDDIIMGDSVDVQVQILARKLLKQKLREKAHEFEVYIDKEVSNE